MENKSFELEVRKVESLSRHKTDVDMKLSRALLKETEGATKINFEGPDGVFSDLIPGSIVKVTIVDPQTKLK